MGLPVISIERISGGEVAFKWDMRNKFTGLVTAGGGGLRGGRCTSLIIAAHYANKIDFI